MQKPDMFGVFHITMLLICTTVPVFFSYRLRHSGERARTAMLFAAGCVLAVLEVYKQWFYFSVVNDGIYDPWMFPFQLCSVPMYLCVVLPLLKGRFKKAVQTFLWDYVCFAALLALIYPEGMMRPHLSMTLHGFLWHAILLFIAFLIFFCGDADVSWKGLLSATLLFLACALLAVCFNILLEGRGLSGSYPDMFYLTPFHMTTQPVALDVEAASGRLVARFAYIAALVMLGGVSHGIYRRYNNPVPPCRH